MPKGCAEWNRFESAAAERSSFERERSAWQEHVWSCAACRREWEARAGLTALFAGVRPGRLSDGFSLRVAAAVEREPAPRLDPRARRWLAAYWVAAACASALIVARTPWPAWIDGDTLRRMVLGLALVVPFVELLPVRRLTRILGLD